VIVSGPHMREVFDVLRKLSGVSEEDRTPTRCAACSDGQGGG
jgi:hypothetical protein